MKANRKLVYSFNDRGKNLLLVPVTKKKSQVIICTVFFTDFFFPNLSKSKNATTVYMVIHAFSFLLFF